MLELVEEGVALEGVTVTLEDRVGRQEGAVKGVVVLQTRTVPTPAKRRRTTATFFVLGKRKNDAFRHFSCRGSHDTTC